MEKGGRQKTEDRSFWNTLASATIRLRLVQALSRRCFCRFYLFV